MDVTEFTGTYAGIPKLEKLDIRAEVTRAMTAYDAEDEFLADAHFLVDQLVAGVGADEVLTWLARDLANLEYLNRYIMDRYIMEDNPEGVPDPALDVLYGALWVCMEDTTSSLYEELSEAGALPWQLATCFYCDAKGRQLKQDRIQQPTCISCWDAHLDGPWEREQDG